tara:strand:+ start:641 stop:1042 length:402 start_codon:yes stop_codon:yes gene_type:complete
MKKLLYIFLGLSLMFGCSDDESNQTETLNGIWNLKNVSGGLAGINIDYNQGDVKWSFNLENNTLIVENNIITTGPEDIYAGLESGTYNIEITQSGEIQTLFINNTERGVLILLNDNLKIDEGFADGFITEFER